MSVTIYCGRTHRIIEAYAPGIDFRKSSAIRQRNSILTSSIGVQPKLASE